MGVVPVTLEALAERVSALEAAQPVQACLRVSCGLIIELVALETGVSAQLIVGDQRSRQFAYPRFMAVWLAIRTTGQSVPRIGRSFGGRDHSTILHARDVFDRLRSEDGPWRAQSDRLLDLIMGAQ